MLDDVKLRALDARLLGRLDDDRGTDRLLAAIDAHEPLEVPVRRGWPLSWLIVALALFVSLCLCGGCATIAGLGTDMHNAATGIAGGLQSGGAQ